MSAPDASTGRQVMEALGMFTSHVWRWQILIWPLEQNAKLPGKITHHAATIPSCLCPPACR